MAIQKARTSKKKKTEDDRLFCLVFFSMVLFLSANYIVKYLRLLKKYVLYYCLDPDSDG